MERGVDQHESGFESGLARRCVQLCLGPHCLAVPGHASGSEESSNVGFRVASIPSIDVVDQVQGDGTFTLNSTLLAAMNGGSLPDGSYVLHLQAVDNNGLTAEVDVPFTLKTSVATPSQPVLLSSNTNNVTSVNTPTIGVAAETGSLVKLFVGNVQAAQGTATGGLQFTLGPLADGTYQITATSTDAAGNSAASPALSITISTSPPAAAAPASASFASDGLTSQAVAAASGPSVSAAVASSLAAPAVLSQPAILPQPSATDTKISDVAVPTGEQDYSAESIMDDLSWLEPNRPDGSKSNSSTVEATDFVLGSLADERLF